MIFQRHASPHATARRFAPQRFLYSFPAPRIASRHGAAHRGASHCLTSRRNATLSFIHFVSRRSATPRRTTLLFAPRHDATQRRKP